MIVRFMPVPVHTGSRLTDPGSSVPGSVHGFHVIIAIYIHIYIYIQETREPHREPSNRDRLTGNRYEPEPDYHKISIWYLVQA